MNRSTVNKSQNRSRLLQPGYLSGKSQPKSTTVRKTAPVNNEGKKVFSRKKAVTSGTKSFETRAAFSNMTNSPEVNEAVVRTKNKSPSAISRTKLNNKTRSENENNFKPQESFTLKTPRYVNPFDKENEKSSASPTLRSKPVGLKKSILQSANVQNVDVQPRVRRLDFSQDSKPLGDSNSKASRNFEFCNESKKENLNSNSDQNDIEFEADPNSLNCILNEKGMTEKMLMDLRVPNQTKDGRTTEVINNMRVYADGRPSGCMRVPVNRPSTAGPRRVRNTGDGRISNAGRPPLRSSSAYKAVRSSLYTTSRKNSLAPSSTLNRPAQGRSSLYTSNKAAVRTSTYTSSTRNAAARKPLVSSNTRKPPASYEVTRNIPSKKIQNAKIEKNVAVTQSSKKAVKWADEAVEEDLIEDSPNLKYSPTSSSRIVITTPRSILKSKRKVTKKKVTPVKKSPPPVEGDSDGEIEVVKPVILNEEEPSSSGVDDSEEITTNHKVITPNVIKIDRVLIELKKGMTSAKRRSLQTEYETVIQMIQQRAAPMETLHEKVEVEKHEEEKEEEEQVVTKIANEKLSKFDDDEDEKERKNAEMLENQIKNLKLEVVEIQSCRKQRELQRSMMGFPTMTPLKSNYYSQQGSNYKLPPPTNCYASLNKPPAASQSNYSTQKLHFSHQQQARIIAESKFRRDVSSSASPLLVTKPRQINQRWAMESQQQQEAFNMMAGGKPLVKKLFDSSNTSGSSQNSTPSKLTATKEQTPNKAAAGIGNSSFFKPPQQQIARFFSPIQYNKLNSSDDSDLSSKGATWSDQLSQYKTATTQSTVAATPSLNRMGATASSLNRVDATSPFLSRVDTTAPSLNRVDATAPSLSRVDATAPSLNRVDAMISQQQEKYTSNSNTLSSAPTTTQIADVKQALSSSFRNHNKLSSPSPQRRSNKMYADDRSYTELAESSPLMRFHPAPPSQTSVDSNVIFPTAQHFTVHTPHALRVYRQRLQEVRHSPYRRISRKYDEMLADEEVALYCSRMNSAAPLSPRTNFVDPVAHSLRFGDYNHFIPVSATPSPATPSSRFVSRVGKSSAFK